jgi:hypothetical protein
LPASSARSIAASDVAGVATKKDDSGSDLPASAPLAQEVPEEFVRADGTKTSKAPPAPVYRNGSSSVTGLAASTVFCSHWPPNMGAGAPSTPEYTMFHRPPLADPQPLVPPMELLRTRYCWLP